MPPKAPRATYSRERLSRSSLARWRRGPTRAAYSSRVLQLPLHAAGPQPLDESQVELPVPGLLQQPLPRLAQGLAGVGGKARVPPPLPGRSGSPPAPPTPAGTGGWRSSQSRCAGAGAAVPSPGAAAPAPPGPGPGPGPTAPRCTAPAPPPGPSQLPLQGSEDGRPAGPGASWYTVTVSRLSSSPGRARPLRQATVPKAPVQSNSRHRGRRSRSSRAAWTEATRAAPEKAARRTASRSPSPSSSQNTTSGGQRAQGRVQARGFGEAPGARRRRGPGRRPPAPPAGPAPPPFGWGRTAPRTGSGPRPGGRWFCPLAGSPAQEQAFTQIRPPEEQGVPTAQTLPGGCGTPGW